MHGEDARGKNPIAIFCELCIVIRGGGQRGDARTTENGDSQEETMTDATDAISPDFEITELEKGFQAVRFEGDDGFEEFLSQGGTSLFQKMHNMIEKRSIM